MSRAREPGCVGSFLPQRGRPQGDVEVAVYVPHEHGGARERRQGRQGPRQAREVPHGRRQPRGEKEREAPDLTQAAAVWNPHMSLTQLSI